MGESEPTDEGKPQPQSGRVGSAHELDVDSNDGLALYHRQRRLRRWVVAVLAGAVLLLIVAAFRETGRQLRATSHGVPIDSGSPASQGTTSTETSTAPLAEAGPPAVDS